MDESHKIFFFFLKKLERSWNICQDTRLHHFGVQKKRVLTSPGWSEPTAPRLPPHQEPLLLSVLRGLSWRLAPVDYQGDAEEKRPSRADLFPAWIRAIWASSSPRMAVANQAACHFEAWHMRPGGFSLASTLLLAPGVGLGAPQGHQPLLTWCASEAQQQENTK